MEDSGNALKFHEGMRILARLIARRITNAHSNRPGDFEEQGLLSTENQKRNNECQLLDENAAE